MTPVPWVLLSTAPPPALYCTRCGTRQGVTLPDGVTPLAALAEAFAQEHAGCRPRPAAEQGEEKV